MFSKGFYKVLVSSMACFLLVFGSFIYNFDQGVQASTGSPLIRMRTHVVGIDPVAERAGHSQTGVTMHSAGAMAPMTSAEVITGVSLVAILDLDAYKLVQHEFAIQPGTLWTVNSDGTTTTTMTGATPFKYYYAFSADEKSVTDWQTALRTGVTPVCAGGWLPASANTPYPLNFEDATAELGRYLAIFMGNDAQGNSGYCVPPYMPDGTISGDSTYVILR